MFQIFIINAATQQLKYLHTIGKFYKYYVHVLLYFVYHINYFVHFYILKEKGGLCSIIFHTIRIIFILSHNYYKKIIQKWLLTISLCSMQLFFEFLLTVCCEWNRGWTLKMSCFKISIVNITSKIRNGVFWECNRIYSSCNFVEISVSQLPICNVHHVL